MAKRVRGHETFIDEETGKSHYRDTGEVVDPKNPRPCALCRRVPVNGHDACIVNLPGVSYACCGHGYPEDAWVKFEDGTVIRGFRCIERSGKGFTFSDGKRRRYRILDYIPLNRKKTK